MSKNKKQTAKLIIASSESCADLYWATRFYVPDPIIYFEKGGRKYLVASDLEVSRAKKEADVDRVLAYSDYEKKLKISGRKRREGDVLNALLEDHNIRHLQVPSYFPYRQAALLKKYGYSIEAIAEPFYPERQIKSADEKKWIRESIRATELGILAARDVLKRSKIKNGRILFRDKTLTSEELRKTIEVTMLENGALGQHTIVACGQQAADPHCRGFGPLYAHQPIVLDVFPKSIKTGYYADLTRTVLKGRASDAIHRMYGAVRTAQETGITKIKNGVDASQVHNAVKNTLENFGFKTGTIDGKPQGFIHSTGHGLGLDIHELPRVSILSNILKSGMVVTVEPGLYYENLGGIRIEDDVFVTATGREVLSKVTKDFVID